jgi:hypothetical protein
MSWKPRSTSTPLLFSVRIATPFTFEASDATLAWLFWGGPGRARVTSHHSEPPFLACCRPRKPAPFVEVAEGQAMT